jgi:hypothetical protein
MKFTMTRFLSVAMIILFMAGISLAQVGAFTALSGKVTDAVTGTGLADYKMLITFKNDTVSFRKTIVTNADGDYFQQLPKNHTFTLSALDTFVYMPFTQEVVVAGDPVVLDIKLEKRADLLDVAGNVSFDGNGVAASVYFLKISDDINLEDFREFEAYFNIPPIVLKWASYVTESGADGNFSLKMIAGKYVGYIPADRNAGSLSFWSAFEITGATQLEPFILKKLTTLAGTVTNANLYEKVMVYAHSLSAGRPFIAAPDSTGAYLIDLAPGNYKVRVMAFFDEYKYVEFWTEGDEPAYKPADASIIEVTQKGIAGIDFNLPEPTVYDFTIKGAVTSKQSGMPIADAKVFMASLNYESNLRIAYHDSTDEKGQYEIMGKTLLKQDSLIGFCTAENFFAQFYDGEATFLTADPIVYSADGVVEGVDFKLDTLDASTGFSIEGSVMDENGKPVTQGQITAYTTATNVGVAAALIDSTGHYKFDTIFPTSSTVYLMAWGGYGYLISIYDGAETWEDADAIIIGSENVTGIDFVLKEVPPTRFALGLIKGALGAKGGKAVLAKASTTSSYDGAIVYVKPQGAANWTAYDYVDSEGNFTLPVEEDGTYEVMISTRDDGNETMTVNVVNGQGAATGLVNDEIDPVITSARLFNAYPNPFNPMTTIRVDIAKSTQASLVVYNVVGQKVKTIYNGVLGQGVNKFNWNGTDERGSMVASGLYFYQLKTAETVQTKAVMFLK